jgi:hypothetical protein
MELGQKWCLAKLVTTPSKILVILGITYSYLFFHMATQETDSWTELL